MSKKSGVELDPWSGRQLKEIHQVMEWEAIEGDTPSDGVGGN